jgi:hypothetical protein
MQSMTGCQLAEGVISSCVRYEVLSSIVLCITFCVLVAGSLYDSLKAVWHHGQSFPRPPDTAAHPPKAPLRPGLVVCRKVGVPPGWTFWPAADSSSCSVTSGLCIALYITMLLTDC